MKKRIFKATFWIGCLALIGISFQNCSLYTSEGRKAFEAESSTTGSSSVGSAVNGTERGSSATFSDSSGNPDVGKFIYEDLTVSGNSCADCHGVTGYGNGPSCSGICPPIAGFSTNQISNAVRNGQGTMPAYSSSVISDEYLEDLGAYLESL